jgi:hypothetical protein
MSLILAAFSDYALQTRLRLAFLALETFLKEVSWELKRLHVSH